jgi:hypothetical protein
MNVEFVSRPSLTSPGRFAIRCWDWNCFSMNMEEYRQKPNWREDGLDYAEKEIPQEWKAFTMLVQFPRQIAFAKRPFFEIYNPMSGTEQIRHDELTTAYQHCFYYSSALNLAMLSVQDPPWPFSYRIAWLLGESSVSATSALVPRQRQRQRNFARKLLQMRQDLESGVADKILETKQLEEGVNAALASVAENVQKMVGEARLDSASLEISLMVLDEEGTVSPSSSSRKLPVLRIVAGTFLADPAYRGLRCSLATGMPDEPGNAEWLASSTRAKKIQNFESTYPFPKGFVIVFWSAFPSSIQTRRP